MVNRSLIFLSIVMIFYYLSQSVISIFLPSYYLQIGLDVNQIILIASIMIVSLGLLPILFLKIFKKYFEKLLMIGIIFNLIFFFLLTFVKDPLILGLVNGLALATFYPAFNLLLFRFSDIKKRGLVVIILYFVLPTLTGIIGPALGGMFIQFFGFNQLFILSISLLFIAFLFSTRIKYEPVKEGFNIPRNYLLFIFGAIIVIFGFSEISWIAYPLFFRSLTQGFLEMGIIASVLSIIFAIISLTVGKISEVEKNKINLAFFGNLMISVWIISLAFVQNTQQLIEVSMFAGIGNAFSMLLFSLYGDFFKRKQHASLVVLWEVFLMFGRLINLVPAYIFINSFNFSSYFLTVGLLSLISIVFFAILKFLHFKGRISTDAAQK